MPLTRRTLRARLHARLLAMLVALAAGPWAAAGARAQVAAPPSCSASVSTIDFGGVDVLAGGTVETGGVLSVSCLDVASAAGSLYVCVTLPVRELKNGTATLAYDIGRAGGSPGSLGDAPIAVPLAALQQGATAAVALTATLAAAQPDAPVGRYAQTLAVRIAYGKLGCTGAGSGTAMSSTDVSATVLKACNVTASDLGFGTVGDLSSAVAGQSALNLLCTRGTGYTVALDGGLSGAADPAARRMAAGGREGVLYGLYQDAARTRPWGTAASATLGGTGTASRQSIPVYGLVPPQPTPSPGAYADTIVVTVTY